MMTRTQFEEYCDRKHINHPEDIEEQWYAYQLEQQIEADETAHLNSLGAIDA